MWTDAVLSWVIREHALESATSNRAETINATVKWFADWKEAPADCIVLMLFRLFQSMFIEILRGRYLHLTNFAADSFTEYMSSSGSSEDQTDGPQLPVDPFNDHRAEKVVKHLKSIEGFNSINGHCPNIPRLKRSRVQLGETWYNIIGPTEFGTEDYNEIYEANVDGRRVVLKFQKADGLWAYDKTEGHVVRKFQNAGGQWEFYIAKELQRRLANAPAIILFFLMFQSM